MPNEGLRSKSKAARLKAMGVPGSRPFCRSWRWMTRRDVWGLWVEMKGLDDKGKKDGRVSKEQADWLERMRRRDIAPSSHLGQMKPSGRLPVCRHSACWGMADAP